MYLTDKDSKAWKPFEKIEQDESVRIKHKLQHGVLTIYGYKKNLHRIECLDLPDRLLKKMKRIGIDFVEDLGAQEFNAVSLLRMGVQRTDINKISNSLYDRKKSLDQNQKFPFFEIWGLFTTRIHSLSMINRVYERFWSKHRSNDCRYYLSSACPEYIIENKLDSYVLFLEFTSEYFQNLLSFLLKIKYFNYFCFASAMPLFEFISKNQIKPGKKYTI